MPSHWLDAGESTFNTRKLSRSLVGWIKMFPTGDGTTLEWDVDVEKQYNSKACISSAQTGAAKSANRQRSMLKDHALEASFSSQDIIIIIINIMILQNTCLMFSHRGQPSKCY